MRIGDTCLGRGGGKNYCDGPPPKLIFSAITCRECLIRAANYFFNMAHAADAAVVDMDWKEDRAKRKEKGDA